MSDFDLTLLLYRLSLEIRLPWSSYFLLYLAPSLSRNDEKGEAPVPTNVLPHRDEVFEGMPMLDIMDVVAREDDGLGCANV